MEIDPLVSVIVPCYNQGKYLSEALTSVLGQTYERWECIVVDDGSTDNTELVASDFTKRDKRVSYLRKTNGGLSDARNVGIAQSKGSFILPLDADDKIGPEYLKLAINEFSTSPQTLVVYPGASYFGNRQGIWDVNYKGYRSLLMTNSLFCSAIYRRSDFDRAGGYDVNMREGFEDWEFWIRLLSPDSIVAKLPGIHFYYRIKEDSMVLSLVRSKEKEGRAINYIVMKHMGKYTETFGGLTHYIREHQQYKMVEAKVRSRFLSKLLFYISRRIVGLP